VAPGVILVHVVVVVTPVACACVVWWVDVDATGTGSDSTSSTTKYNKSDTRPIISRVAQAMLSKFGALVDGGSGAVRLVRA
jgi:hypothetical protein